MQICRSVIGYLCCAWQEAIDASVRADAILRERCAGGGRERDTFTAFWLYSLYFRGDLAELARRLPDVVRDAEERGDRFALSSLGTFAQPMAALCQDDPESVRAAMEAAVRPWTRQAFQIPHYNHLVTGAQVELYAGRPAAARRIARRPTARGTGRRMDARPGSAKPGANDGFAGARMELERFLSERSEPKGDLAARE